MPPDPSDIVVTPVILAGGKGARLWPLTSPSRPKPFLRLFSKYSLFQKTLQRAAGFASPVIVTEKAYLPFVERDLEALGVVPKMIIVEPKGRNTAPAVIAAALLLQADNALMLVMPSDHVIDEMAVFKSRAHHLAQRHQTGSITLIGIEPCTPNPHFGYILPAKVVEGDSVCCDGVFSVADFIEKPAVKVAKTLIKKKNAFWHSGMFLCFADDLCRMAEAEVPEIIDNTRKSLPKSGGERCIRKFLMDDAYVKNSSISVDYTILEAVSSCYVGAMRVKWQDVGTWRGLFRAFAGKGK